MLAQAEHRARYPDWRFRPGANALAKLRAGANADARTKAGGTTKSRATTREKGKGKEPTKEKKGKEKSNIGSVTPDVDADVGGGSGSSKRRRVNPQTKDQPRTRSNSGLGLDIEEEDDRCGSGEGDDTYEPPTDEPKRKRGHVASVASTTTAAGTDTRKTATETRCAKIADLLVEGKTGVALEVAVKEWEGGQKRKAKLKEKQTGTKEGTEDNSRTESEAEARDFDGHEADPQAYSVSAARTGDLTTSNLGSPARKPPHLLIPPQFTNAQPTSASPSIHMLSPTCSPASSHTQSASPYTQTTASPYAQTPASPYIKPPSPYIHSLPSFPQHSRSQSLYGRFPRHEAGPTSTDHDLSSAIYPSHSQPHPPSYTRGAHSNPGETHSSTQHTYPDVHDLQPQQDDADPELQDSPRPLDLATYTADALARGTPLTQLFKRSLSAPASENRSTYSLIQPQDVDSIRDAEAGVGDTERGRHPGRVGDRTVEPTPRTMSFSLGGGGHPPLPSPHLYLEPRPSAHPQDPHSPSHLPSFPHTHPGLHATFELQPQSHPENRRQEVQHHDDPQQHHQQQEGTSVELRSSQDPPPLTWMDEEQRRRLEAAREHGYWWNGDEDDEGSTDADAEGDVEEAVGDEGLGYDDASNEEFDIAYSQVCLVYVHPHEYCLFFLPLH